MNAVNKVIQPLIHEQQSNGNRNYNGNYNTYNGNSTGKVNMVDGKQSNYSASITENKCVFTIYTANGNYTFNLSKNKPQQKSSADDYVNNYHNNYHSDPNRYDPYYQYW